jgi:tRNA(fMet)-specific endonuclease VapC
MSTILLDTNIVSFIFKGSDYATPYKPLLNGHELAISFMSIAELYQWAFMRQWSDRRIDQLKQYLSNYLVIPTDQALCQEWGRLRSEAQRTGRAISAQDAWIAATALQYDLELVTHNLKDFQGIPNIQLLTPNQP